MLGMPCKSYIIYNPTERDFENKGAYWSNDDGWGNPKGATRFTESERRAFRRLPGVGSKWVCARKKTSR